MKYNYLPFECKRIPDGYRPVEAYLSPDGKSITVPCEPEDDDGDRHNCDAEGCGTMSHVKTFWQGRYLGEL